MLGHKFYHESLRKYIILFGTLFNDLRIERRNSNDNVIQKIKWYSFLMTYDKTDDQTLEGTSFTEWICVTKVNKVICSSL